MNSNLKFADDFDDSIDNIRKHLMEFSAFSKISALNAISERNITEVLDEIKICAYDFRPVVRIYAYKALSYAKAGDITEILKDALRDEDSDAFKAARELYQILHNK